MSLTDEQMAVVEATDEAVICIAGAGAGKTTVLTQRIQHLLDQGVPASSLFVSTFTRKAAGELLSRLKGIRGHQMMVGTFHSLALQILTTHCGQLGYDADSLTIIDDTDATTLLEKCADDLALRQNGRWKGRLSLKKAKRELESHYTGVREPDKDRDLKRLVAEYWYQLKSQNAMDYGRILQETLALFDKCPELLGEYQSQFSHLLIDEMQDIDAVQFGLVELLGAKAKLFFVGDPRQSIYSFRGARPDLIKRLAHAKTYHLTKCFRCTEQPTTIVNVLMHPLIER